MSGRESIKIVNGALDEIEVEGEKQIVLRGVIDPDSIHLLQVGSYQREVLPLTKISKLVEALETSKVPDIELGVRDSRCRDHEEMFYLPGDVFIVDGLQRVSAAKLMMQKGGDKKPHLGATIHFETTEEWERKRFKVLNANREKVSPNILLRNAQREVSAIGVLYRLCDNREFVLKSRVCWSQQMQRGHLITAVTFLKTTGTLHSHLGPGRGQNIDELAQGIEKITEAIGQQALRDNVKTFFDIVDQCWGIRTITFRAGAAYMHTTFLYTLARLFSRHPSFWRENRLFVERDVIRKITLFPVTDPQVVNLSGAGGQAGKILYQLLLDHVNSGRRTKRLISRHEIAKESESLVQEAVTGA